MSTWKNVIVATVDAFRAHGLKRTFKQIVLLDQPRTGTLVGTDDLGNEYYQNQNDVVVRDRWVLYKKWNYDPTQVPPEWHQWLHRFTDDVPTPENTPRPIYTLAYSEFQTGTPSAFKTYNTVKPKIESWKPSA